MDFDLVKQTFVRRKLTNSTPVAPDGAEALAYLGRGEADEPLPLIIMLNLKRPRVAGPDALREIKSHPQSCTIPVLVLTSSVVVAGIQEAYTLSTNSYIAKPVHFNNFLKVAAQAGDLLAGHQYAPSKGEL